MRTTIDLPPEVMRAAKAAALERGVTLKVFFTKAVIDEIGMGIRSRKSGRALFPFIRTSDPETKVDITNADIQDIFDAEDVEKYIS